MKIWQIIRALLATSRIANVPSVIVNVLTGMLMMQWWSEASLSSEPKVWLGVVSACLLYLSGNFLNDWYDRAWDSTHRPERALPSGLIAPRSYLLISVLMMATGAALAGWIDQSVLAVYAAIAILVMAYTLIHKRHAGAIWLMGGCRAGLYLMGMMILSPNLAAVENLRQAALSPTHALVSSIFLFAPMVGMTCYIAGISLLARYESKAVLHPRVKWWALGLLLMPLLTHTIFSSAHAFSLGAGAWKQVAWIGAAPLLFWTLRSVWQRGAVSEKVARLLAGIVLVDGVYWWTSASTLHVVMGGGQVDPTLVPLYALAAALLLQKVAPAT